MGYRRKETETNLGGIARLGKRIQSEPGDRERATWSVNQTPYTAMGGGKRPIPKKQHLMIVGQESNGSPRVFHLDKTWLGQEGERASASSRWHKKN